MFTPVFRASIRKANSAGLVTATAGPDLLHTLSTNRSGVTRSAIIRKVLAYNNTGANITIQLGTITAVPAFVALLPVLLVINGMENIWQEGELPCVEFSVVNLAGANFRAGNIYLQASAVGVVVSIETEEYGS